VTQPPGGARSLLPGALAAVASGLLLALAFPGFDWGPLAFVALVPLCWAWRDAGPGRAALFGFVGGLAFFGLHLWWAVYFGAIAIVPLLVAQSAYWAAAGAVVGGLGRLRVRSPFVVAAAWVLAEALRTRWPLGGFAWGQTGVALHDLPFARALAEWGGVPLVTFLVVLVNALILEAVVVWRSDPGRSRARTFAVGGLALVVLVVSLLDMFRYTPTATGQLRVAMLQGNDLNRRLTPAEVDREYLTRSHLELARRLRGRYDLIVLPESGLQSDPEVDPGLRAEIAEIARRHGSYVVLNAIDEQTPGKRYNANRLYSPSGALVATYAKQHLVPFGEYVPWRDTLDFVSELEQVPTDFDPGDRTVTFDIGDTRVGTAICFESAFGPLVRTAVRDGAQMLVVTTNNRSYRRSPNAEQHLALSQMSAAATARPLLQASISGISAVIDASGRVSHTTRLFHNQVVTARVTTVTGKTPYVRFGDWVEWACFGGLLGALVLGLSRRRLRP